MGRNIKFEIGDKVLMEDMSGVVGMTNSNQGKAIVSVVGMTNFLYTGKVTNVKEDEFTQMIMVLWDKEPQTKDPGFNLDNYWFLSRRFRKINSWEEIING